MVVVYALVTHDDTWNECKPVGPPDRIGMPVFDISTQKTHSGEFSLAKQQLEEALRIQTKELLGMKREQASFALKFFELTYSSDL